MPNSKSFEDSTKIKIKYEKKNTFKEIENCFLENNNNNIFQKPDKITLKNPTKYIIPNEEKTKEEIKEDENKQIEEDIKEKQPEEQKEKEEPKAYENLGNSCNIRRKSKERKTTFY